MVMAKTASLNATNRQVSRYTEGGSAPALPPGARAIASQRTQRITEETPAAPRRATPVGHRIDQCLSAWVSPRSARIVPPALRASSAERGAKVIVDSRLRA